MDLLFTGNPGGGLKLSAFAPISSVMSGEPPKLERVGVLCALGSTSWLAGLCPEGRKEEPLAGCVWEGRGMRYIASVLYLKLT